MEYVIAIAVLVVVVYFAFVRNDSGSSTTSTTPSPAPAPEVVADVNNNGITSKAELKTLTKVQLFDFAEKQNLKVKKSGTKAQVINEIHSQLR
jgi:hypothetical protein|tara:strand:- start:1870 stop:2148 length:279 start_codon:yes stop_codon:yes gene_type:complete